MKILQVINSFATGGAERLLVELCPRLMNRGLDCYVLLLTSRNDQYSHLLLKSGVKVFAVSSDPSPYNLKNIIRLNKYIHDIGPDIIHAHLFPAQYFCALAKVEKAVLITTEHNSFNRRMQLKLLKPIDLFIYKKYSKIIAISDGVKEALDKYLGNGFPIELIYNGINTGFYKNLNGRNRNSDGKIVVGMAARFVAQKDQATIVRAISVLPSNYYAIFAGDGDNRRQIEQLTRDLGISDRIQFLGTIDDIRLFLSKIDIYIQSSNWEGFGIAALEAMAAGLPVIASDVPGLREVLCSSGRFFPPGDYKKLANHIKQLEPNCKRIGEGAICARQAQGFDIEKMADSISGLYASFGNAAESH